MTNYFLSAAVKNIQDADYNDVDVEKQIQRVLKDANDREGGRELRAARKRHASADWKL